MYGSPCSCLRQRSAARNRDALAAPTNFDHLIKRMQYPKQGFFRCGYLYPPPPLQTRILDTTTKQSFLWQRFSFSVDVCALLHFSCEVVLTDSAQNRPANPNQISASSLRTHIRSTRSTRCLLLRLSLDSSNFRASCSRRFWTRFGRT